LGSAKSRKKKTTFGSFSRFHILSTFSAQSDKFRHQDLQREKERKHKDHARNKRQKEKQPPRTSSGELLESWGSREISVSFDFFERLAPRTTGTFLTEVLGAFGDFAAGSTSYAGDPLAFVFSAEGAMAASLFGSSSSLQRKPKERDFTQLERRKESKKKHRVGKILTSPRGQKVLLPLLDQGLLRPQFSK
jgi:hypothetical protein